MNGFKEILLERSLPTSRPDVFEKISALYEAQHFKNTWWHGRFLLVVSLGLAWNPIWKVTSQRSLTWRSYANITKANLPLNL